MSLKTILLTCSPLKSYMKHILPLQWLQISPHTAHHVAAEALLPPDVNKGENLVPPAYYSLYKLLLDGRNTL